MNTSWYCPKCNGQSAKCYRCTECGADLAETGSSTEGSQYE